MTAHALTDLSVLDQYAVTPFAPGYAPDHRTFSAPADNCVGVCTAVLQAASASLVLAMYSLTHPELVAATVAAIETGISSLVVLDSSEFDDEAEQRTLAPLLALRGRSNLRLSVGTSEKPPNIMHRKVAVIDGSVCITGSFNWTESAVGEDNQLTCGIWPSDAALLTASIERTYAYQIANCAQPAAT